MGDPQHEGSTPSVCFFWGAATATPPRAPPASFLFVPRGPEERRGLSLAAPARASPAASPRGLRPPLLTPHPLGGRPPGGLQPPQDVGWKPRPRLPPARGLTFSRRFRAAAAAGNNGGCCLCVSLPHCLQYGDLPLNYIFILSAILAAYMTPQPSQPSLGSSTAQIPSLFLPLRGNPGLRSLKIGPAYSFPSFFFCLPPDSGDLLGSSKRRGFWGAAGSSPCPESVRLC